MKKDLNLDDFNVRRIIHAANKITSNDVINDKTFFRAFSVFNDTIRIYCACTYNPKTLSVTENRPSAYLQMQRYGPLLKMQSYLKVNEASEQSIFTFLTKLNNDILSWGDIWTMDTEKNVEILSNILMYRGFHEIERLHDGFYVPFIHEGLKRFFIQKANGAKAMEVWAENETDAIIKWPDFNPNKHQMIEM